MTNDVCDTGFKRNKIRKFLQPVHVSTVQLPPFVPSHCCHLNVICTWVDRQWLVQLNACLLKRNCMVLNEACTLVRMYRIGTLIILRSSWTCCSQIVYVLMMFAPKSSHSPSVWAYSQLSVLGASSLWNQSLHSPAGWRNSCELILFFPVIGFHPPVWLLNFIRVCELRTQRAECEWISQIYSGK